MVRASIPSQHPESAVKVITVGCSDDYKEVDVAGSRMIDYSGRGPTSACVCKPDIVAPGSSIISCANRQNGYTVKAVHPCLRLWSQGRLHFAGKISMDE